MHEYRSEVAATTDRQAGGGDVDHSALIASALTNLLTNAFKFSHAKGHVWLRTSATKDHVTFAVEDQCGGLPVSTPDELFAPWAQRHTDKRGLGLGLPLTRRSVQASGGDVSVQNLPGKGCIFSIRMLRPAPTRRPGDGVVAEPLTT